MKIIAVDNLNRETVADRLVATAVDEHHARFLADAANFHANDPDWFYKAVPDDHRLWGGMAELV